MGVLNDLIAAVHEIFSGRASVEPAPDLDPRPLPCGRDVPPLFVGTSDLAQRVAISRFIVRHADALKRFEITSRQLESLKGRTRRLIPSDARASGDHWRRWSFDRADLALIDSFDRWAIAVGGREVRRHNLDPADLETTLRVLENVPCREIPVKQGVLYGYRVDDVAIVIQADRTLEDIDRELVALQGTWLSHFLAQRDFVLDLDRMSRKLSRQNEELSKEARRAERAAAARRTFLAHMSHELRTPLNGILGVAQLLEDTRLTDHQRELVQMQIESGRWLREIVDAVLDLSKIEAESMVLARAPFDLYELMATTTRGVRVLSDGKGVSLKTSIEETVPRFVDGDETRIRQSVLNLLSNAIKFTDQGFVHLSVEREAGTRIKFAVRDTGVGMPPDRVEAVFDPFAQAEASTSNNYGGTGLGLPLVREFARLHGGEAGGSSLPGEGSTFWFTADLPACAPPAAAGKADEARLRSRRVLVVDDDGVNQKVARMMLEKLGHTVEVVGNGREAVERIREHAVYDLVLMDRMMPEMDGITATREIRTMVNAETLPVVGLTASAMADDVDACLRAGMQAVLTKPLAKSELFRVLTETSARKPRES